MEKKIIIFGSILFLLGCSSSPQAVTPHPAPVWLQNPTRTVDEGYIVYIGQGEDVSSERAIFKAESIAIGDLTNECSVPPKGSRFEDRYEEVLAGVHHVYAKLGVTFEECEQAKKAVDPQSIRRLANTSMAEQWKRFQDSYYAADQTQTNGNELSQPPSSSSSGSGSGGVRFVAIQGPPDYFIYRQQVAYVKQDVVLAPPTAYAPGSPQSQQVAHVLAPANTQLQQYEHANPTMATTHTAWSGVQRDSAIKYPSGFSHYREAGNALPKGNGSNRTGPGSRSNPGQRRMRRHSRW